MDWPLTIGVTYAVSIAILCLKVGWERDLPDPQAFLVLVVIAPLSVLMLLGAALRKMWDGRWP